MGIVVFAVTAEPKQTGHDHLWTSASAGFADHFLCNFEAGEQVSAVNGAGLDAVACSFVNEGSAGELPFIGSGIGVVIVGHKENQRQFLHCGLVDGFMEGAGRRGALADARGADGAPNSLETMSHESAIDHRNHSTQVAYHRH
jgi:hypothetical protein